MDHVSDAEIGGISNSPNNLPYVLYMGVSYSHYCAHGTLNSTQSISQAPFLMISYGYSHDDYKMSKIYKYHMNVIFFRMILIQ